MNAVDEAQRLEAAFLSGLNDAQDAYEQIVAAEAWVALGFESFAEWWQMRVQPIMRALSMRPAKELAAAVVDQVRREEATLPPAQRRTKRELADLVGVHRNTIANQDRQCAQDVPDVDLEEPAPDPLASAVAEQIEQRIADKVSPPEPERPRPQAWDPVERDAHEAEVRRRQDIEAAHRYAKTLVPDVRALIFTVLHGYRLGETGLVTRDMIADLRSDLDLLEKEITDAD